MQRKVVEIDSGVRSDDERIAQQQNLARTQSHKDTLERVAAKKNKMEANGTGDETRAATVASVEQEPLVSKSTTNGQGPEMTVGP